MTICSCNKNNFNVTLNLYIDDHKRDVIFYVTFAEYGAKYKEYNFKTLKAAYNKFDLLCEKYNLLF